ncbi:COG1470 family protein [Cohnella silvisoli]|uniref:DUF916 domain-containing protein n=1 Tax=Cohnella silvisoli TaxID=2873699 RepID=A0ABV1KWX7_9BACL|nr:hypothetical protein [Cohnella silvisoli]MCD9023479.1 hypothetical protein [Cohnella silvisoli]
MGMRLLLSAIVIWIATGFTNPTNVRQLIISGDTDRMNLEVGGYVEEIIPGDQREYAVHITNPTHEAITALLYVADAIPALDGGTDFTMPGDSDTGSAAWYTTSDRNITLKAGETQSFTLNMQIPENVEPGQYASVIGVYNQSMRGSANRKSGLQVVLNYKLDEARPPEAVPHAAVYTLENGTAYLTVLLVNEGGSISEPEIAVRVKRQGDTNEPLFERKSTVNTIYAGTVAQIRMELGRPLSSGTYMAEITTEGGAHMEQKTFPIEVVSKDGSSLHERSAGLRQSDVYGGILLILVAIVLALRRRASRKM